MTNKKLNDLYDTLITDRTILESDLYDTINDLVVVDLCIKDVEFLIYLRTGKFPE